MGFFLRKENPLGPLLWAEQCLPKHLDVLQNITIFGDRVFKEVIKVK